MIKLILLILMIHQNYLNADETGGCLLQGASRKEIELFNRLKPLFNKTYKHSNKDYNYYFGFCIEPTEAKKKNESVGMVQERNDTKDQYVVGRFKDIDVEGTDDFIRMNYRNGDNYGNACNQSARNAVIYIQCANQEDDLSIIEENSNRIEDCAYVFMLKTKDICLTIPTTKSTDLPTITTISELNKQLTTVSTGDVVKKSGLGAFGIIMIVLSSTFVAYLLVGTLYMRFVKSQRGWYQIPNFSFWNRIGNINADICNYICRCNNVNRNQAQPYESLTSDQLSDDENILNV